MLMAVVETKEKITFKEIGVTGICLSALFLIGQVHPLVAVISGFSLGAAGVWIGNKMRAWEKG